MTNHFYDHVIDCVECKKNAFFLCEEGRRLLKDSISKPLTPTKHLIPHDVWYEAMEFIRSGGIIE